MSYVEIYVQCTHTMFAFIHGIQLRKLNESFKTKSESHLYISDHIPVHVYMYTCVKKKKNLPLT